MFQRLRSRLHGEEGFTLIELLVVILIIGILAAIAIPSFLNQKGKANDAATKSAARTAQTAIETYATDHNGSYTATNTDLHNIEPTLQTSGTNAISVTAAASLGAGENYKVTATNGGRSFSVTGKSDGTVEHTCTIPDGDNAGGCVLNSGSTTDGKW